jgi:hypothetical protein
VRFGIMTTMTRRGWTRPRIVAATIGLALLVAVGVVTLGIFRFGWDWKTLIGWSALVDYINPKDATGRKDAVQVYAVIVAGVVATITAAVGLVRTWNSSESLKLNVRGSNESLKPSVRSSNESLLKAPHCNPITSKSAN